MNWEQIDWALIWEATVDTSIMTGISLLWTVVIGLPLGVFLYWMGNKQNAKDKIIYQVGSLIVNIFRSIPFLILLIVMIPLTRAITGTSLGVPGSIPPLVVASAPFFARLVEIVLREVDPGVTEACEAMGAKSWQTILWALLPEATAGIISGIVVTAIALIGYSAMSGVIGGGGLGDVAIRFGYQRYQTDVMVITVAILIIMVQIVQMFGDRLVLRYTKK